MREFLSDLDPRLGEFARRFTPRVHSIDRAVGGLDGRVGEKYRFAGGHSRRSRRVRCAPRRRRFRRRAGNTGQNHRDEHLRHRGLAKHEKTRGHSGLVRHCGRQRAAGIFRTGSRPVGRGRHFQLVRELYSTRRKKPARTRN